MSEWGDVRDWEIAEAVSDMSEDSYSFVGRDIFLKNGTKPDFLRYREEGYIMEARFYWSDEEGVEEDEVMKTLKDVRELLMNESFRPRLSISSVEAMRPGYIPDLEGDYHIGDGANEEDIRATIDSLTPEEAGLESREQLECKR